MSELKVNLPDAKAVGNYSLPYAIAKVDGFSKAPESAKLISMAVARIAFTTLGEQLPAAVNALAEIATAKKLPKTAILKGECGKGERTYSFTLKVADIFEAQKALAFLKVIRENIVVQISGPAEVAGEVKKTKKVVEEEVIDFDALTA